MGAVAAVFLWPLDSDDLRSSVPREFDYAAAVAEGKRVAATEESQPAVLPECRTQLLSHGKRTAKAVVLLHGYTDCPRQMTGLAQRFFEQGYNVYVPRAPRHGEADPFAPKANQARELVAYASAGLDVAAGLGDEVGVAGHSGGGVLATWLAGYRADVVQRALVMAPFFAPHPSQLRSYQTKPFTVLFGLRVLPDKPVGDSQFTYAGLSQYLRITANLQDGPGNRQLRSVAVVTSAGDDSIDPDRAVTVIGDLARANGLKPRQLGLSAEIAPGHDFLSEPRSPALLAAFVDLYEDREAKLG